MDEVSAYLFHILATQPLWLGGLLFVAWSILAAAAGHVYVRRHVGVDTLARNNEVAGFEYAIVGVVYAVLLTFVVVVVWEDFQRAESAVNREAAALVTLFGYADSLAAQRPGQLRTSLLRYAESAAEDEWRTMADGRPNDRTAQALADLYDAYETLDIQRIRDAEIYRSSLELLNRVTESRRARLDAAAGAIPPILYVVLSVGALITIGFSFFFGALNARAQLAMTALLTFMISQVMFLIVILDHPFTGSVRVSPHPLMNVIEEIKGGR